MTFKLTPENADSYLRNLEIISENERVEKFSLGGGVSNRVIQVKTNSNCYVLKQPLKNLDVNADWPADIDRIHNEAAAARVYNCICGNIRRAHTPKVVNQSHEDDIVVFTCVPSSARMWKQDLLKKTVDNDISKMIGTLLGNVHNITAGNSELQEEFADKTPFKQLRIDPYHRTIAQRHSDVAKIIHNEIDRLLQVDKTLVHGDYSPKNILVSQTQPTNVWALDFEVAHWGDPAFDTAFMLNHLFIKSVYNNECREDYVDAIESFWTEYNEAVPWNIEKATVTELAILMLARVDGKSPVEYIESNSTADVLRATAKHVLKENISTIDGFNQVICKESAQL